MQCTEHTCYAISIAGDHIISCLKPGGLGHWVDHILLPMLSHGAYESKDACPERRLTVGLQEESMFNVKRNQFLI